MEVSTFNGSSVLLLVSPSELWLRSFACGSSTAVVTGSPTQRALFSRQNALSESAFLGASQTRLTNFISWGDLFSRRFRAVAGGVSSQSLWYASSGTLDLCGTSVVSATTEECQVWLGGGLPRTRFRGHRATASLVLWQGLYPSLINLNGDRPLQKCYRQHQTLMPSETQQDSLGAAEWATLNSHPMSDLQERPRLSG